MPMQNPHLEKLLSKIVTILKYLFFPESVPRQVYNIKITLDGML